MLYIDYVKFCKIVYGKFNWEKGMGSLETNLTKLQEKTKEKGKHFYRERNENKEKKQCVVCEKSLGEIEYKGKNICVKCMKALKSLA